MGKVGGVEKLKILYLGLNFILNTRMSTTMWKVKAVPMREQMEQGLYGKLEQRPHIPE